MAGGSNLIFNVPESGELHEHLLGRNDPKQHELSAIYRASDGADLYTILSNLQNEGAQVTYEVINVETDGQTVVTLTTFQYNMAKDELYINVAGVDCLEGTDHQYVKLSPTQIQFNFPLKTEYKVLIAIAGIKSRTSFGDDIYNSLSKFTQLVDVPQQYHGSEGKYARVNQEGTGLIFDTVSATNELVKLEYSVDIEASGYSEKWINFVKSGVIKGIKVTGTPDPGVFDFNVWTKVNGNWVYKSGTIDGVLWDIMDIPFVDESSQNSVYVRLNNNGPRSLFLIQIYVIL